MGTITKPHGVRGEVALFCPAENPSILQGVAFLAPPSKAGDESVTPSSLIPIVIERVRKHHQAVLIFIEGLTDRTKAEEYRQFKIFLERDKFPSAHGNEVYLTDIIGFDVFELAPDNKPTCIGKLSSIGFPAGQELWSITTPQNEEILFPAVPEFVNVIDTEKNVIYITPPPGLIELYVPSKQK